MPVIEDELETMSVEELWLLHEKVASILVRNIEAEKAILDERLRRLESRAGPKVLTSAQPRRPYPQVVPKYRNPANPVETWSGRGKQPRWLASQLNSGKE